jgi:hypothetical protein
VSWDKRNPPTVSIGWRSPNITDPARDYRYRRNRRSTSVQPHLPQTYQMRSLPPPSGSILTSLMLSLQPTQVIRFESGLRSSFISVRTGSMPFFQIRRRVARLLLLFGVALPRLVRLTEGALIGLLAGIVFWCFFAHAAPLFRKKPGRSIQFPWNGTAGCSIARFSDGSDDHAAHLPTRVPPMRLLTFLDAPITAWHRPYRPSLPPGFRLAYYLPSYCLSQSDVQSQS